MEATNFEYLRRTGTNDMGREYEFKILGLLALRCINKGDEDFWLISNAEGVGSFDDVILHIQGKTFLLQLKHQENPKVINQGEFLASKHKDFSLRKYWEDVVNLKSDLETLTSTNKNSMLAKLGNFNDVYFILYTNRPANEECTFLVKMDIEPDKDLFYLNTASNNDIYKFDVTQLCDKLGLNSVDCISNFYLFSNQSHVMDVDKQIRYEIEKIATNTKNSKSASEDFIKFIIEWSKGHLGGNYCLTRRDAVSHLTSLLLSEFKVQLFQDNFIFYKDESYFKWNSIVNDKTITIVDVIPEDNCVREFLLEYIGSEIKDYCNVNSSKTWSTNIPKKNKTLFYKKGDEYKFQMLKLIGKREKINLCDVYKCLWILCKVPLLLVIYEVEEFKQIIKTLKISNYFYKIIICNKTGKDLMRNNLRNCFQNLTDLNKEHQEIILEQRIKLQGRSGARLKDLIDTSVLINIRATDVIYIISGIFNIGKKLNSVPSYYIDRSLKRIFIRFVALESIKNEIFLIEDPKDSFELIAKRENLNIARFTSLENINLRYNVIVSQNFPKTLLNSLISVGKCVHHVIFHDPNYLEWKRSQGTIENIKDYKVEFDTLWESDVHFFDNQINLISAPPGMGKSILMDHIAQEAPVGKWVLRIDLNQHQDYYESLKCENKDISYENHLSYLRHSLENELSKKIFGKFMENRNILILLDGFDEVSLSHKEEVTSIIKSFVKNGFYVWLTTRPIMKIYLEEELSTFAFSLVSFTEEIQRKFLKAYFRNKCNSVDLLDEFTGELLDTFKENIVDQQAEFTGTPLHTRLLAEYVTKDLETFLSSSGKIKLKTKLDLLDLYDQFIQEKIKILCDKYGSGSKDLRVIYKDYQSVCALKSLFPSYEEIIEECFEDYDNFTESHIQLLQKEGILSIDENFNINFVHRTFAEYIAAEWLSENINNDNPKIKDTIKILIAQRFSLDFSNIQDYKFSLFDRFLSKDSKLHLSIIDGNVNVNNLCNIDAIDKAKRSVLHLLALYVRRHPSLLNSCLSLVNCLFTNNYKITTDLLGYSPIDYALINNSIDMANIICKKWTNSKINIDIPLKLQPQYLSNLLLTNYKPLFETILPYFVYRDIMSKNITLYETVFFYLTKFLPIEHLGKYKDRKISDISNLEIYINSRNIFYKIILGDQEGFRKLLKKNKKINTRDIEGKTALHYAVLYDQIEITKLLLSNGADINAKELGTPIPSCHISNRGLQKGNICLGNINDRGNTALHYAILYDKPKSVDLLLSKGADINIRNLKGDTSLHYGIKYSSYETVDKLLSHKPNLNVTNKRKNTPLHIAILKQKVELALLLLSGGAEVNLQNLKGNNALHCCIKKSDDNKLVSKLLSCKVDANAQNEDGDTPLHIAIAKRSGMALLLLSSGSNLNIKNSNGDTPLHLAVDNDDITACFKLISYKANANIQNIKGYTPLHRAAMRDNLHIIDLLLSTNPDTNIKNDKGETALHLSIKFSKTTVDRKLISYGADINACTNYEVRTPLHFAVRYQRFNTIVLLLSNDAKVNSKDIDGDTPLHYSVKIGNLNTIEKLLSHKANINLQNNQGYTPLHHAILYGKIETIPLLLSGGADITIKDLNGDTPLHHSIRLGQTDIIETLKSNKVDIKML